MRLWAFPPTCRCCGQLMPCSGSCQKVARVAAAAGQQQPKLGGCRMCTPPCHHPVSAAVWQAGQAQGRQEEVVHKAASDAALCCVLRRCACQALQSLGPVAVQQAGLSVARELSKLRQQTVSCQVV
jgi:hypothetical protein